jgi:hypothetical protein
MPRLFSYVLIDHGAHINAELKQLKRTGDTNEEQTESLFTPLGLAVDEGHTETVKILPQNGADVNAMSANETPLIRAVDNEDIAMVRLLLQHKADPELPSLKTGHTPLTTASELRNPEIVQLLLDYGAN